MVSVDLPYQESDAHAPYVRLTVRGPVHSAPILMLVDSGADKSMISWKMGLYLGFAEEAGERLASTRGVGGSLQVRQRRMDVTLGNGRFQIPVLWAGVEMPALLGREGIFDRFRVEFDQGAGIVRFRL